MASALVKPNLSALSGLRASTRSHPVQSVTTIRSYQARPSRSSNSSRNSPSRHGRPTPLGARGRRVHPADVSKFINPSTGFMETTAENRDFMLRTGITHDSGLLYQLPDKPLSSVMAKYSCLVSYSPEWIIHPYDLHYLTPRGSPFAPELRSRYEMKMAKESLWINTTCWGSAASVVRHMMKRRLKGAVHRGLMAAGYDSLGNGGGDKGPIRGTLGIHIYEPLKGIDFEAKEFGDAVVRALQRETIRLHDEGQFQTL